MVSEECAGRLSNVSVGVVPFTAVDQRKKLPKPWLAYPRVPMIDPATLNPEGGVPDSKLLW